MAGRGAIGMWKGLKKHVAPWSPEWTLDAVSDTAHNRGRVHHGWVGTGVAFFVQKQKIEELQIVERLFTTFN